MMWRLYKAVLDEEKLRSMLPVLGLGDPLFFYKEVASTNDIVMDLAEKGATHGTLVVAGAQTAGRGRRGRRWSTAPGRGLALSVLLRSGSFSGEAWPKYHALGALAVVEALDGYGLDACIKWPNDVLLEGRKVAGVLVEASWEGDQIEFAVLGIGVNVCKDPLMDTRNFDLPVISIEEILREQIDWCELLMSILKSIGKWASHLNRMQFIETWERRLAYRGKEVVVNSQDGMWQGTLVGLNERGALKISSDQGVLEVQNGYFQVRLREEI